MRRHSSKKQSTSCGTPSLRGSRSIMRSSSSRLIVPSSLGELTQSAWKQVSAPKPGKAGNKFGFLLSFAVMPPRQCCSQSLTRSIVAGVPTNATLISLLPARSPLTSNPGPARHSETKIPQLFHFPILVLSLCFEPERSNLLLRLSRGSGFR